MQDHLTAPKRCPNPQCSFYLEHDEPATFTGDEITCPHCGMTLVSSQSEPTKGASVSPTVARKPTGQGKKRLQTTVGVLFLLWFALHVVYFIGARFSAWVYGNYLFEERPHGHDLVWLSGLAPFITAAVLVELASLVCKPGCAVRAGPPGSRRRRWKITLWLTAVLGIAVVPAIQSAQLFGLRPQSVVGLLSSLFSFSLGGALNFGYIVLALRLSRVLSRKGLGPAFGVILGMLFLEPLRMLLLAGYAMRDVLPQRHALPSLLSMVPWWLPLVLLAALGYRWWTRRRDTTAQRNLALPVPSSGYEVLAVGPAIVGFIISSKLIGWGGPNWYVVLAGLAMTLALIMPLSKLYNQPGRVHALLRWFVESMPRKMSGPYRGWASQKNKRNLDDWTRTLTGHAAWNSLAWIGLIAWLEAMIQLHFEGPISSISPLVVPALWMLGRDVVSDYHAWNTRDDWTVVWREHRVYAAPILRDGLEAHGVPVHLRGLHFRSLLQFFGPYVPIHIMVPKAQEQRAKELLASVPVDMRSSKAVRDYVRKRKQN